MSGGVAHCAQPDCTYSQTVDRKAIASVAVLADDVRRSLYAFARDADVPVTRESAARGVGISRKLAAFHLDRLVEAGLLTARIATLGPRRVGRAPKIYEPTPDAITVYVPDRDPDLLASVLADAVEAGGRPAKVRALRAARERGRAIGSRARELVRPGRLGLERSRTLTLRLLADHGFEPAVDGDRLVLRNCPFHPLAAAQPELVCGMNWEFVCGLTEGLGARAHLDPVLAPAAGRCCVEIRSPG